MVEVRPLSNQTIDVDKTTLDTNLVLSQTSLAVFGSIVAKWFNLESLNTAPRPCSYQLPCDDQLFSIEPTTKTSPSRKTPPEPPLVHT
jgi:hypothetical protein